MSLRTRHEPPGPIQPTARRGQAGPPPAGRPGGGPLAPAYVGTLAALVAVAAGYGLAVDDAYRLVPDLTRATWRAQDALDLALVPVLLWSSRRARRGSLPAHLLATGLLLWWTYGYAHLAVGAPLNAVFLVYVAILLLAGFATLDGLVRIDVPPLGPAFDRAPRRAAAWFLTLGGVGIGGLWLGEIAAAWPDRLPPDTHLAELPNPTWVLDLAWLIPMCLGAAALLRRRHPAGPVIAAVVLVALLALSASMLLVAPFAVAAGLPADPAVRTQVVAFSVVFAVLGAVEARLLAVGRRRLGPVPAPWLRPGWWSRG